MELLTISEVAEMLRYNVKYFRNHYREWSIPYTKFPNKVLFKRQDVDEWIEARYIGSMI